MLGHTRTPITVTPVISTRQSRYSSRRNTRLAAVPLPERRVVNAATPAGTATRATSQAHILHPSNRGRTIVRRSSNASAQRRSLARIGIEQRAPQEGNHPVEGDAGRMTFPVDDVEGERRMREPADWRVGAPIAALLGYRHGLGIGPEGGANRTGARRRADRVVAEAQRQHWGAAGRGLLQVLR